VWSRAYSIHEKTMLSGNCCRDWSDRSYDLSFSAFFDLRPFGVCLFFFLYLLPLFCIFSNKIINIIVRTNQSSLKDDVCSTARYNCYRENRHALIISFLSIIHYIKLYIYCININVYVFVKTSFR